MEIQINLDTANESDLAALTALVRSLSGGTELEAETIEFDGVTGREQAQRLAEHIRSRPQTVEAKLASGETITAELEQDDDSDEYVTGLTKESVENPEGAPDTDSRGLPWDERIHAGTKATNADGTWRNRRGVDKDLVAEVEAELRGASAADDVPEPVADAPEPPAPDAPSAEPAAPTPPAPDAPEPPAPTGNAPTFKDAMARVTAGQRDGTVTQEQVASAAQALGLTSVVDLAKPANAHLIEGFIAALG